MESMEPGTEPGTEPGVKSGEETSVEENSLFVIDTQGEKLKEDLEELPNIPVKKLKRRNAAMYAETE